MKKLLLLLLFIPLISFGQDSKRRQRRLRPHLPAEQKSRQRVPIVLFSRSSSRSTSGSSEVN